MMGWNRPAAGLAALALLLLAGDSAARELASYEELTAITDDERVCRDPLPVTVHAPAASAFTERQADVERLIGGIRAILGFECHGQTEPQTFTIIGEVEGRTVFEGSADAGGLSGSLAGEAVALPSGAASPVSAGAISSEPTVAAPRHNCDELAAHPDDPAKIPGVAGVADASIDGPAAFEACLAAVEAHPDEHRFAFQFGRVLMLGGEIDLATGYLSDAAAGGSAAAFAYLGDLEEDPESALDLYEAAAAGGFAPAAAVAAALREEMAGVGENGVLCDDLAAHPADPARPSDTPGVSDDTLDPLAAADACVAALAEAPDEPRYHFQLGRSLVFLEGMESEAKTHLKAASDAGYAAASAYLAGLVEDDEEAERLLRVADGDGFAPAGDALAQIEALQSQAIGVAATRFSPVLFARGELLGVLASGQGIERTDGNLAYLYGFLPLFGEWCEGWPGPPAEIEAINRMMQTAYRRLESGIYNDPLSTLDRTGSFINHSKAGEKDVYKFVETYGCEGTVHDAFVSGVRKTLPPRTDTAASGAGEPRFVESCARGKLSSRQCQCLADVGSGVIPDIHTRQFSREMIPRIINSNPMIGFALMGQCGIVEY